MKFVQLNNKTVIAESELNKETHTVEKFLDIKTTDIGLEKHVPFITITNGIVSVKTGKDVMHPAVIEHHLVWYKLAQNDKVVETLMLNPIKDPIASFKTIINQPKGIEVYVYCNIHGVWKGIL